MKSVLGCAASCGIPCVRESAMTIDKATDRQLPVERLEKLISVAQRLWRRS